MNVLCVHNDYARPSGEEHAVQNIAAILESHGHRVSWLRASSEVIGNSVSRKFGAFFSGIYSPGARRRMEGILGRETFDLVQVQNLYPLLSPSVLGPCHSRGFPVVMRCPNYRLLCPNGLHLSHGRVCELCLGGREWHCVMQNCLESRFKSVGYALRNAFARVTGMIVDNVNIFVVLSEFQKRRFAEAGIPADRIEILPNIAPKVEEGGKGGDDEGDAISFVGRVSPEKGILRFLDAARKLRGNRFVVAGDTDAMPGVRESAPGNVEFRGFLRGRDLDAVFRESRILVFPSLWFEGFPNVVAQAMAWGRPVVAMRMGALPEIVDDGKTGLLCNPDEDDLAERIDYLWRRPDLCREMGRAGREKALSEYSDERFYSRLMAIYEKALAFKGVRSS